MVVKFWPKEYLRFPFYFVQLIAFETDSSPLFRVATVVPLPNRIKAATTTKIKFMDSMAGVFTSEYQKVISSSKTKMVIPSR